MLPSGECDLAICYKSIIKTLVLTLAMVMFLVRAVDLVVGTVGELTHCYIYLLNLYLTRTKQCAPPIVKCPEQAPVNRAEVLSLHFHVPRFSVRLHNGTGWGDKAAAIHSFFSLYVH